MKGITVEYKLKFLGNNKRNLMFAKRFEFEIAIIYVEGESIKIKQKSI